MPDFNSINLNNQNVLQNLKLKNLMMNNSLSQNPQNLQSAQNNLSGGLQNNLANNILNNSINNSFSNVQNSNLTGVQNNLQANVVNGNNSLASTFQEAASKLQNKSLIYSFETAEMENQTVLKYLQNLMDLPNSIEKFVSEAANNKTNDKLVRVLVENLINTQALGELLNSNSKAAMQKLLALVSSTIKQGAKESSQMRELLSVLSSIQAQTSSTNSNALKEFLLLYIPLNYQVFDKNFDNSILSSTGSDIQDAINNSELSILFQTKNFSNIFCALNSIDNELSIEVFSSSLFPFSKFQKIIDEFSKTVNLNLNAQFRKIRDEKEHERKKYDFQNFKIISQNYVSTNVLLLSNLIIKIVFKIDDDFSL